MHNESPTAGIAGRALKSEAVEQVDDPVSDPTRAGNERIASIDNLDLLRFHIVRQDAARASIQNRASMLLTASAIVLAATSVLYSSDMRAILHHNRPLLVSTSLVLVVIVALTVAGIWNALSAMVGIRSYRIMFGPFPSRGLYAPYDVARACPTYEAFHDFLADRQSDDEVRSAEATLWSDYQIYVYRYRRLRRGVGMLFAATLALLTVTAGVLFASALWV